MKLEHAELRPPPEHEGKKYHWLLDTASGVAEPWGWWGVWVTHGISEKVIVGERNGYRYLGPAEWNPVAYDVAKRLEAGAGAYHALANLQADHDTFVGLAADAAAAKDARIAELEAENARLTKDNLWLMDHPQRPRGD